MTMPPSYTKTEEDAYLKRCVFPQYGCKLESPDLYLVGGFGVLKIYRSQTFFTTSNTLSNTGFGFFVFWVLEKACLPAQSRLFFFVITIKRILQAATRTQMNATFDKYIHRIYFTAFSSPLARSSPGSRHVGKCVGNVSLNAEDSYESDCLPRELIQQ